MSTKRQWLCLLPNTAPSSPWTITVVSDRVSEVVSARLCGAGTAFGGRTGVEMELQCVREGPGPVCHSVCSVCVSDLGFR